MYFQFILPEIIVIIKINKKTQKTKNKFPQPFHVIF